MSVFFPKIITREVGSPRLILIVDLCGVGGKVGDITDLGLCIEEGGKWDV